MDTTRPKVDHTEPKDGEVGVPSSVTVRMWFTRQMDPVESLAAVTTSPPQPIQRPAWESGGRVLNFWLAPLEAGSTFSVRIGVGASDLNGNRLETPHEFKFTVQVAVAASPSLTDTIVRTLMQNLWVLLLLGALVLVFVVVVRVSRKSRTDRDLRGAASEVDERDRTSQAPSHMGVVPQSAVASRIQLQDENLPPQYEFEVGFARPDPRAQTDQVARLRRNDRTNEVAGLRRDSPAIPPPPGRPKFPDPRVRPTGAEAGWPATKAPEPGTPLPGRGSRYYSTCINCGAKTEGGAKWCHQCGDETLDARGRE
jgi:hypothetical protein